MRRARRQPCGRRVRRRKRFLVAIRRAPGDVLIIGSGTGTDVGIAISLGAARIDAVEIDPRLYELGKQLQPDDWSGGTFTLTNPGVFGAILGTPIIPMPQVAIIDGPT